MKKVIIPATEQRGQIEIEYEEGLVALDGIGASDPALVIVFSDTQELIASVLRSADKLVYTTGPSIERRDLVESRNPSYHYLAIMNPDSEDRRTLVAMKFHVKEEPRSERSERRGSEHHSNVVVLGRRTLH